MEFREASRYTSTTDFTAAEPAVPATAYSSLAAIEALAGAAVIRFDEPLTPDRPVRCIVHPIGVGAEDSTYRVSVYVALPSSRGGVPRIDLQYLGLAEGALSDVDVDAVGADPGAGEPVDHQWAKTCDWTSSGFAEALSGGTLQVKTFPDGDGGAANAAGFSMHDIGPGVALVMFPARGASTPATSVNLVQMRWR